MSDRTHPSSRRVVTSSRVRLRLDAPDTGRQVTALDPPTRNLITRGLWQALSQRPKKGIRGCFELTLDHAAASLRRLHPLLGQVPRLAEGSA